MAGVLIATPNIAVDRTVRLPELRPGEVLRPERGVTTAGGKGLNVARASSALGRRATLVGFRGDGSASLVDPLFAAEPVEFRAVPVAGETRVATIYLEDSGRATVLNEPGPDIAPPDWRRFEQAVTQELDAGRYASLVCSGSLPPGAPDDGYARLVAIGRAAGVRVVVDAARAVLAAALPAAPDVVAPNLAEAEGILQGNRGESSAGTPPDVRQRACAAAAALRDRGARAAVVTAGAAGVAYGDVRSVEWLATLPVRAVNPIGAGDAFVAGLVHALDGGAGFTDSVVFAVAVGTASVEQPLAGDLRAERARDIAARLAAETRQPDPTGRGAARRRA